MTRNLRPEGVARMTDIAAAIRNVSGQKELKYTIIPAGYRLTIDSWENDMDNQRTIIKDGLTLEECKFHLELCQLHTSHHDSDNQGFGNLVNGEDHYEYNMAILEVLKKHKEVHPSDIDLDEELKDEQYSWTQWTNYAHEIIHDYFGASEYDTRVFEDFKVEFIPEEIKILDVSNQF